jgi:peptidoglycan/LPS O-acetylase OafA/YrhL
MQQTRYDFLDGLRGIAAIVVVIYHCFACSGRVQFLPYGSLAVDFFFCLSGFVVCHAYTKRLATIMSFREFCIARFLRLYPMILMGVALGSLWMFTRVYKQNEDAIMGFLLSIPTNLLLLPSPFYTQGHKIAWPLNSPLWSLTFEIFANLVWARYFFNVSHKKLYLVTAAFGVLLLSSIHIYGFEVGYLIDQIHLGIVRVLFPFFAGVAVYRWSDAHHYNYQNLDERRYITGIIALLLFFLCMPYAGEYRNLIAIVFIFIMSPAIIFWGSKIRLAGKALNIFKFLGFMSYPLYVLHMPFLRVVQAANVKYHFSNLTLTILFMIACILATITAYIATTKIEPIIRSLLKEKMYPASKQTA